MACLDNLAARQAGHSQSKHLVHTKYLNVFKFYEHMHVHQVLERDYVVLMEIVEGFRMMLERMDKLVVILQTQKLSEDAGVASVGHRDWLRDIRTYDIKIT